MRDLAVSIRAPGPLTAPWAPWARALTVVMTLCVGAGCMPAYTQQGAPPPVVDPPDDHTTLDGLSCVPLDPAVRRRVTTLYERTDTSVHELVTCGGLQYQLAASFIVIVLASNTAFFNPQVLEDMGPILGLLGVRTESPLDQQEDGSWRMTLPGASEGSAFDIQFYEPGGEKPTAAAVFDMETYLVNAQVQSSLSWAEMMEDLSAKSHYTITYDAPGPLSHLLNDGAPLPEGQFELDLSFWDFAALVLPQAGSGNGPGGQEEPNFGPFESLVQAEMASHLRFVDQLRDVFVTYRAESDRDTVAEVAGTQRIGFGLTGLEATNGVHTLVGTTDDFHYVKAGLAGFIDYQIRGPEVAVDVRADFGEGARYPRASWRCPE